MQGKSFRGWKIEERKEKHRKGERREEKKQSRGDVESNCGSFLTSFLLLALYPVQQSAFPWPRQARCSPGQV